MYAPEEGAVDDTVGMRKMDWKEVMAASASDGESLVEVESSAAAAMAMVIVMIEMKCHPRHPIATIRYL